MLSSSSSMLSIYSMVRHILPHVHPCCSTALVKHQHTTAGLRRVRGCLVSMAIILGAGQLRLTVKACLALVLTTSLPLLQGPAQPCRASQGVATACILACRCSTGSTGKTARHLLVTCMHICKLQPCMLRMLQSVTRPWFATDRSAAGGTLRRPSDMHHARYDLGMMRGSTNSSTAACTSDPFCVLVGLAVHNMF